MGSPPVRYTGCFDTGSADTWVPAAACTNPACMTHSRFEPRSSSTYQTLNAPFQITYGTGSVAGFVGSDLLTLGGSSNGAANAANSIQVVNQGFGIVFDSSMDFLSASCDGLFGLAFPELSEMQVNPAFFNMMRQGSLDADVFGLWLSPSPTAEPAGALTFGALDQQHYTGGITWIPVTEKAYWTVPLGEVLCWVFGLRFRLRKREREEKKKRKGKNETKKKKTETHSKEKKPNSTFSTFSTFPGGAAVGFPGSTSRTVQLAAKAAIMDSGTTAILMSDADSARVHAAVPGLSYNAQGGYYAVTGGCEAVSSLPDITFILGGRPYAVPARLWTQQIPKPGNGGGVACISGIIPGGDANSIILGDNFLRAWYTAYRYDKSAHTAFVGIAKPTDIKLSLPGEDGAGGSGVKAVATPSSSKAAAVASQAKATSSLSNEEDSELEAAIDDSSSSSKSSSGSGKKDTIRIGPIAFAPPRGMRGGMGGGRAAPRAEGLMSTRSAAPSGRGGKAPTSIGAEQANKAAPAASGDGMSSTSFGMETGR